MNEQKKIEIKKDEDQNSKTAREEEYAGVGASSHEKNSNKKQIICRMKDAYIFGHTCIMSSHLGIHPGLPRKRSSVVQFKELGNLE